MASLSGPFTLDSSVLVSAFSPNEVSHFASRQLLNRMRDDSLPAIQPWLLLPEVAAAISRAQDNAALALRLVRALASLPHFLFVPLDQTLADLATEAAAQQRLRSGDAIFVAVARRFDTILVTLDTEQLTRAASVARVCQPQDVMSR